MASIVKWILYYKCMDASKVVKQDINGCVGRYDVQRSVKYKYNYEKIVSFGLTSLLCYRLYN